MNQFFGGSPIAVILRLVILSIVVGIVLSAMGITPDNFFYSIRLLAHRIYDMGFGAIDWLFGYFVLGAIIVVPIWIIARVIGMMGGGDGRDRDR